MTTGTTREKETHDVQIFKMAQRLSVDCITTLGSEKEDMECAEREGEDEHARPVLARRHTEPIAFRTTKPDLGVATNNRSNSDSHNVVEEANSLVYHRTLYAQLPGKQCSESTIEDPPLQSESSYPKSSLASSATWPDACVSDDHRALDEHIGATARRLLKSTVSMRHSTLGNIRKSAVQASDFRLPPQQPEKRFVDDIGMLFPGISDRQQCTRSEAHFVTSFRLCEPTEYTTALADHGLTYEDYCRLITALRDFLNKIWTGIRRRRCAGPVSASTAEASKRKTSGKKHGPGKCGRFWDTTEQLKKNQQEAVALNQLLEEITWNLQARGVSVMVCVHSFSLFAPSRVSESHIQILHVDRDQTLQAALMSAPPGKPSQRMGPRLSFVDAFPSAEESEPRPTLERQAMSAPETIRCANDPIPHQAQSRDRSKPYLLWPNAVPLRKRQVLNANIDRYGADPYFRAWMRASINASTRRSTYAKYLAEMEDNPLANRRKQYADTTLKQDIVAALVSDDRAWKGQFPSAVNRTSYEHNRRLECRQTVERGTRLRVLRFSFRHPIYPPHTPEMDALGLNKHAYHAILTDIDRMHTKMRLNTRCPGMYVLASLMKVRRKGTKDAVMKAREYIRRLNASQRELVWTIEKIPWVYDKGGGRNRTEWEISAWNAADPLELLMQLERWGIIQNRMSLGDED